MTIALVPVKRLADSKSRLLDELPDRLRQALTLAMLADLIEALQQTRGIDRIAVTTPDPAVAVRAEAAGAEALMRPEPGLNDALEDAITRLVPDGVRLGPDGVRLGPDGQTDLLIVLGDVAGAAPADFERLLAAAAASPEPGVWLAPSSDGGSSAVLQHPAGVLPCCFGRDSAKRHRDEAGRRGIRFCELPLASLAIDLDQPEDLEAFRRTSGGGRRTRALLESSLPGTEDVAHRGTTPPGDDA
jgi:2-phospho-L-lactate guanylyltransferase